jgi:hypothetical protein
MAYLTSKNHDKFEFSRLPSLSALWRRTQADRCPLYVRLLKYGLFFQIGSGVSCSFAVPLMSSGASANSFLPAISAVLAVVGFLLSIASAVISLFNGDCLTK